MKNERCSNCGKRININLQNHTVHPTAYDFIYFCDEECEERYYEKEDLKELEQGLFG